MKKQRNAQIGTVEFLYTGDKERFFTFLKETVREYITVDRVAPEEGNNASATAENEAEGRSA